MSTDLDQLRDAITGEGDYARSPDAHIERDTICQGCGYNLHGLPESGECPECGTPAAFSIKGDRLQYAHPKWLRTVRRGLIMTSISPMLYLPVTFVLGFITVLLIPVIPEWLLIALVLLPPGGCSVLLGLGAFLMTAPEPRLHGDESPLTWRRAVRDASILAGIVVPVYLVALVLWDRDIWRPSDLMWDILAYALLAIPAAIYGCLGYLRTLARRIPDPALVTTTNIVIIGLPASSVLFIILTLSPLQIDRGAGRFWLGVVPISLFLIWTFALIWMYTLALDSPAAQAQPQSRAR